MSRRTLTMTDPLYDYLLAASLREPPLLRQLREETARMPNAQLQLAPEQGQFLAFLVRTIGARCTLELGVFTGYSALCVALALPPDGRIVACDVSEEWTGIARRYWEAAGVADKIDLRIAPALQTLDGLIAGGAAATFDFAFIDADKDAYPAYYERCLALLRPGGVIAIDNVLRNGSVADPSDQRPGTVAMRAFNTLLHEDTRIDLSLLPIGDGLTLARKRYRDSSL
jgi:predicted O-methyltransferase YrrM